MRLKDADDLESRLRVSAAELDTTIYTAPSSQINGLYREFIRIIRQSPTIDPVQHGRWIITEAFPHHVYCSICSKTYIPNDKWQIWTDGDLPPNYCPNCGARMDEVEE